MPWIQYQNDISDLRYRAKCTQIGFYPMFMYCLNISEIYRYQFLIKQITKPAETGRQGHNDVPAFFWALFNLF